jgi:hypothetical protein
MENWGLITGRTTAFLFDPAKSDLKAKKRVAVVQSHEVSATVSLVEFHCYSIHALIDFRASVLTCTSQFL